ncbi:Sal-like protein 4, partial [Stegodyphus mimosarum]
MIVSIASEGTWTYIYQLLIEKLLTQDIQVSFVSQPGQQKRGRQHYCTVCPYTTKRKSHMDDHIRKHTGERPFVCSICKKAFSTKSYIAKHKRTQHYKKKKKIY